MYAVQKIKSFIHSFIHLGGPSDMIKVWASLASQLSTHTHINKHVKINVESVRLDKNFRDKIQNTKTNVIMCDLIKML